MQADFNGRFGDLMCPSHEDTCPDDAGNPAVLRAGMVVTAFEPDIEDGQPADTAATGIVELSPDWLQCAGSRWVLRIDEHGVRHESPDAADCLQAFEPGNRPGEAHHPSAGS